jgi:hypothetical protein
MVQHVDAWVSADDVGSGARWTEAVAKSLEATNFGIVCVTRANQLAPWLNFEAGALAKSLEQAKVVPLCIDLPPSDLAWPLAAFQGQPLDEEGVRNLVGDVSAATEPWTTSSMPCGRGSRLRLIRRSGERRWLRSRNGRRRTCWPKSSIRYGALNVMGAPQCVLMRLSRTQMCVANSGLGLSRDQPHLPRALTRRVLPGRFAGAWRDRRGLRPIELRPREA